MKVIRFDEVIKGVFCAKNVTPYGYFAIVGTQSTSVYLAYAEEGFAVYDHIWTLSQYDCRRANVGASIALVEFLANGTGDFLTYSQTGQIAQWSLSGQKCLGIIAKLPHISQMCVYSNAPDLVCYSRVQRRFFKVKKDTDIKNF